MNLIACVSKNWGIGKDNALLFQLPGDKRRFRELTWGNYVIMGRKTFESMGSKPLEGRGNIVLSRTLPLDTPDVTVCRDLEELYQLTDPLPAASLFVIGGGEVYHTLEPLCSKAYITWVDDEPPADCFLANLDESADWRTAEESQMMESKTFIFQYITYERFPRYSA